MTVVDDSSADEMVKVIDADSHLTEPADLWTEALPVKWREKGPSTSVDPATGIERWRLGDRWLFGPGSVSHAGWPEFPPSRPPSFEEIQVACYDAHERVKWMDEHGVTAQVLYPNLVAFEGHAIMALDDEALKLAIVRVYNDYVADFARQAPGRFIPIAGLPFWSLDDSIAEMRRCADLGHRGVMWAATLARHGLPASTDPYWDPFYAAAEELGLSVNFHVGVGWTEEDFKNTVRHGVAFDVRVQTARTALGFVSNVHTISDLILQGVCERFPTLNFVSVESGFGWVPYVLDALDWQFCNYNGPELIGGLLPSEYFRRQIFTMFWFESSTLKLLELYPDNVMFETDFPHTTSLSPGRGSIANSARAYVQRAREALDPVTFRKVMYENAAKLYGLER